jgi:hypothetical protein
MAKISMTNEPVWDAFAVTPSDGTALTYPIRGFHVGVAGNVALVTPGGTTVVFVGCVAGAYYPYAATYIRSTSTTATSIVGLR